MTRRSLIAVACGLLATCATAPAADKGIHITGGGIVFAWILVDGAGFRWDIYQNGTVNDGSNDAYNTGMRLSIAGSAFSAVRPSGRPRGRRSKDEREIEIGPWSRGALRVWRRIYVDPKLGYCRWIDIFQNTGSADYNAPVQYQSGIGGRVQKILTTSGKGQVTAKDWGFADSHRGGSPSRPRLVHVFASRGAKVRPTVKWAPGKALYYHMTLKIPAGKTVALCFFEAQRRPEVKAVAFLKKFSPFRELQKVPPALRRIIVNMSTSTLSLGAVELRRDEKLDLAVLQDQTEQLGSIVMDKYVIETFYGTIELPVGRVVGVYVPVASDSQVHVALTDGQIVAGKLANGPIRFKLAGGNEMALPTSKLRTIAYRVSKDRPRELQTQAPMISLRCRQRLRFDTEDAEYAFHTEYGEIKLLPADLSSILLDTPDGGLHRAIFRNGSVLSGLLVPEDIKTRLELGPTLDISRHLISRFHFADQGKPTGKMLALTLRNENVLYGRIAEKSIQIKTRFGSPVITPAEIAELELVAGTLDRAHIKLRNGTTVRGRLIDRTLRFKIEPGPELPIFVGHIMKITCPGPVKKVTTPPAEAKAMAKKLAFIETLKKDLVTLSARLQVMEVTAAKLKTDLAKKPKDAKLTETLARLRREIDTTKHRIAKRNELLSRYLAPPKQPLPAPLAVKKLAELSALLGKLETRADELSAKIAKNPEDRRATMFLGRTRKLIDRTKGRIAEIRKDLAVMKARR